MASSGESERPQPTPRRWSDDWQAELPDPKGLPPLPPPPGPSGRAAGAGAENERGSRCRVLACQSLLHRRGVGGGKPAIMGVPFIATCDKSLYGQPAPAIQLFGFRPRWAWTRPRPCQSLPPFYRNPRLAPVRTGKLAADGRGRVCHVHGFTARSTACFVRAHSMERAIGKPIIWCQTLPHIGVLAIFARSW